MIKRLTSLAIAAIALCGCESAFPEPECPQDAKESREESTRNTDSSDSTGVSPFTIELEEENEVDLDFLL